MDGKLTINKITNCTDLTIKMDNATIVGDYSNLEINDISNSSGTHISMTDMKVMTTDQYQRSKSGGGGSYSYGSRYGGGGRPAGQLTVNKIVDSHRTTIDQDRMKISGRFDDVKLNDVARSSKTDISMRKIQVNVGDSSSDDSSDDDAPVRRPIHPRGDKAPVEDMMSGLNHSPEYARDEEELPKPSSYEYYIADKFSFNIRLGGGANVTCTFLQKDRVKTVKKFIRELQPRFENKDFRLQVVDTNPPRYVDDYPEKTLMDAGFTEKMDLRTVITSPSSDNS